MESPDGMEPLHDVQVHAIAAVFLGVPGQSRSDELESGLQCQSAVCSRRWGWNGRIGICVWRAGCNCDTETVADLEGHRGVEAATASVGRV